MTKPVPSPHEDIDNSPRSSEADQHSFAAPPPPGSEPAAAGAASTAYDAHHPPDPGLLADCVHCGFCLPTCPTYSLWGEEMDSPRGRIYLMNLIHEGAADFDDTLVSHFDTCLGCMACVTSCPSGVQYDKLLESMRPQIERHHQRSRAERAFRALIFGLFPHPRRLRLAALAGLAYQRSGVPALLRRTRLRERLPARLNSLESLLPPVRAKGLWSRPPVRVAPQGARRLRVALLTGCVQRVFFDDVNAATARVLASEGAEVLIPPTQGCCGALSLHTGREPEALEHARETIATFERYDVDAIVVNVAGCGSSMKDYANVLRDDPDYAERAAAFSAKVCDVSEVLAELDPRALRHPIPGKVAYHDACHLGHAQGVRAQPRAVLKSIPGLRVSDIPEADICCGSAGVYNLLQPEAAAELGQRKAANIQSVDPDAVATANPGCLLQVRHHLNEAGNAAPPLFHPVQLLDASIRGVNPLAS